MLSWVSFDLPVHLKTTLNTLLVAAGEGNTELHKVPIVGRDIRDDQPESDRFGTVIRFQLKNCVHPVPAQKLCAEPVPSVC